MLARIADLMAGLRRGFREDRHAAILLTPPTCLRNYVEEALRQDGTRPPTAPRWSAPSRCSTG